MMPMFRLSQGQLNLLETCPRQFQRTYLEQRRVPPTPNQQEGLRWGEQFHQILQQQALDLPLSELLSADEVLAQTVKKLMALAPELFCSGEQTTRLAEHSRACPLDQGLLTVIYDLLLFGAGRAWIVDWKTYREPQNRRKLAQNWQTRLYQYVLAETSAYVPAQIVMVYCFVKRGSKPTQLHFNYSDALHRQNEQDLKKLIQELSIYRDAYLKQQTPFPHRPHCVMDCDISQRGTVPEKSPNTGLLNFAEIEEISWG